MATQMGPKEFERKAKEKKTAKPKEKLRSISIRIAEQGFIGSCSYERVEEGNGKSDACCSPWMPDKDYALADRAAVDKFLDETLHLNEKKES